MESKPRKIKKLRTLKRKLKNLIIDKFGEDWFIGMLIPLIIIISLIIVVFVIINYQEPQIRLKTP